MASIQGERHIDVSPEIAWDALRDWAGLRRRLVPGFVTGVRVDGEDRIVTFFNDLTVRERRVAISEHDRRLVWTVADVDGPFDHFNGAAQILAGAGTGTRFVWITDVLPDDVEPQIRAMMERGLDTIKQTLELVGAISRWVTAPLSARIASPRPGLF